VATLLLSGVQFQLSGESNSIKYDVTPQFFDCGMQPYDRAVERELFVNNPGKVRPALYCCVVCAVKLARALSSVPSATPQHMLTCMHNIDEHFSRCMSCQVQQQSMCW
jgi:hypothetical protein